MHFDVLEGCESQQARTIDKEGGWQHRQYDRSKKPQHEEDLSLGRQDVLVIQLDLVQHVLFVNLI